MDEKRLIELIARKLAGEATCEELLELKNLSARYPDAGDTEKILTHVWELKDEELDASTYYDRHRIRHEYEFEPAAIVEDPEALAPSRYKYILPVTLAVILISAVAAYLFFNNTVYSPAYTLSEIVSGKGVRKSVKLPDGSAVFLNSDSRISFDANMNRNKERIVTLSGEAFFDVSHHSDRPFIIHTKSISVRVMGTAFNVKAYPNDKKCETTLIRGSIELSLNSGDHEKFLMKPSEKLTISYEKKKSMLVNNGGGGAVTSTMLIEHIEPVMVSDKEYVPETSWIENRLIFDNETLEELVPKLERWYNVKISIVATAPAGQRFTGALENETIVQALTAMKLIKPFNFTVHENDIMIY